MLRSYKRVLFGMQQLLAKNPSIFWTKVTRS